MLNEYYDGVELLKPQPVETYKKSYREENKHWFNI